MKQKPLKFLEKQNTKACFCPDKAKTWVISHVTECARLWIMDQSWVGSWENEVELLWLLSLFFFSSSSFYKNRYSFSKVFFLLVFIFLATSRWTSLPNCACCKGKNTKENTSIRRLPLDDGGEGKLRKEERDSSPKSARIDETPWLHVDCANNTACVPFV